MRRIGRRGRMAPRNPEVRIHKAPVLGGSMHLRRHIMLGVALTAFAAGSVQACPKPDATKTALLAAPPSVSSTRAATLVAWKPRAWAPATPAPVRAQGLRVAIDPVDGTLGMPSADELSQQVMVGD